jgi:hypothetical protein
VLALLLFGVKNGRAGEVREEGGGMVVGIGELLGAVDTIMPDCGGEVLESSRRSTGSCRVAHVMEIPRCGVLPYLWGEKFEYASNYYVDK